MTYTTRDGLVLSDEMYAAIKSGRGSGQTVVLSVVNPASGGLCQNCGGAGSLYLDCLTLPSQFPSAAKPNRWHEGRWWTMDRRAWLCPVCGAQSQAERNSLLFERSGLIANERDWHLDYIADMAEKETALASALGMLAGVPTPSGWLLFYGSYGVGKSGILKSLTAAMCRAGVGGRYVNAMDIVLEIQAGFNLRDRDETARAIIDRYAKSPFLAVDEIDRVNTSQWTMSILFKLFDERYNLRHLLATALATNRTPESLRDDAWSYFESRTRDGTRVRVGGAQLRGHEIQ